MNKKSYTILLIIILFIMTSCGQKTPSHMPKNPRYQIIKPKVKYSPSKKNLAKMVKKLQGSPYVWAEEGPNRFDCSGFTYYLYGSMGIEIPRVARNQAKVGKRVAADELQYGDLIFFATSKKSTRRITHVGMYLGNGWFTHASTIKHEVIYSNLFTSPYYKKRLRVCRRYLPDSQTLTKKESVKAWKVERDTLPVEQSAQKKRAVVINVPLQDIEKSTTDRNYYIQVGSFVGNPKHALVYRITRQNLNYKVIRFSKDGEQISKLLIGPYYTRAKALEILPIVKEKIKREAFIAEIR